MTIKKRCETRLISKNRKDGVDLMEEQIILNKYTCERCNHKWLPRTEDKPIVCPKCKSPYWDQPRQMIQSNNEK